MYIASFISYNILYHACKALGKYGKVEDFYNVPVGKVSFGFEAGKIHYEGHWKGWALEIETGMSGPKIIEISRAHPF